MKLNEIRDVASAYRPRKRVGRGIGSGIGKTGGRGFKGQKARSGVAINGYEGGQMPLYMRLPKRGFNNLFSKNYSIVSVGRIQEAIDSGKLDVEKPVTVALLKESGIVRRLGDGVRLLSDGDLSAKVHFEIAGASKNAIAKVEKAGGSVNFTVLKTVNTEK